MTCHLDVNNHTRFLLYPPPSAVYNVTTSESSKECRVTHFYVGSSVLFSFFGVKDADQVEYSSDRDNHQPSSRPITLIAPVLHSIYLNVSLFDSTSCIAHDTFSYSRIFALGSTERQHMRRIFRFLVKTWILLGVINEEIKCYL